MVPIAWRQITNRIPLDLARLQATNEPREAAEHGDHVTPETLRAELSGLESRLYRAMLVQAGAIVGALVGIAGIVVGVLRLFG